MDSLLSPNKKAIEAMLAAACHFGHKVSKWNAKMRPYLYTKTDGIHIFDLAKTYDCLMKALEFLRETVTKGKTVLLVSTKLQAARLIEDAAQKCGVPYVTRKWMPGLLTNFETLRKRIKYFCDLKEQKAKGEWEKYTKKERLELQRILTKLEDAFSGVENMTHLPDVVLVLDAVRDILALRESRRLRIATVGICDSNADPDLLTYPIPGNDDAIKSLKYFIERIIEAIMDGKQKLGEQREKGRLEPTLEKIPPKENLKPQIPVV